MHFQWGFRNGRGLVDEGYASQAARNLDSLGTDVKSKSFLSFSPLSIQSKLNSVGFNLGSNKAQVEV